MRADTLAAGVAVLREPGGGSIYVTVGGPVGDALYPLVGATLADLADAPLAKSEASAVKL